MTFSGHSGNQGFVISAHGNASVTLENTIFTSNHGTLVAQQTPLICSNTTQSSSSSILPQAAHVEELHACFAPELPSSVIYLQQSSLAVGGNSSFSNNSAGGMIVAKGGRGNAISLGRGTVLRSNSAGWLLVADSWQYDAQGQRIISAPHMKLFNDANAPNGRRIEQEHDAELLAAKPYTTSEFARHLPMTRAPLSVLSSKDPLVNASASLEDYLRRSPAGVAPMAVTMDGVDMSGNAVEGGLLWLRLVHSTLAGVSATENVGGLPILSVGNSSASANSSTKSLTARVAASVLEGTGSGCDPPVYDSLIRVVGPQSFSMYR